MALPLGLGATVEGQVTGEETWGGIQLQAFALTESALGAWRAEEARKREAAARAVPPAPGGTQWMGPSGGYGAAPMPAAPGAAPQAQAARSMGIGAGGTMRQQVFQDDRPGSDWAETAAGRVFVHLVTPPDWRRITGEEPPPSPVDRAAYTRAGLPWFDYYDEGAEDLAPTDTLGAVKPAGDWLGDDHEPWQAPGAHQIKPLGDAGKPVADGDW